MVKQQPNSNRQLFRFHGPAPEALLERLPPLRGRPIIVTYRPMLTEYKGKLLSRSQKGNSVYAGCLLRKRRITLDDSLLRTPRVWERIFAHEVAHFMWSRLHPGLRDSYEQMIREELCSSVPGELGWSSESIKLRLLTAESLSTGTRWRNYLCESFCDTAGWLFSRARRYSELTLPSPFRTRRRRWWSAYLSDREFCI